MQRQSEVAGTAMGDVGRARRTIASCDRLETWNPSLVRRTEVSGAGAAAMRVASLADGGVLTERFLEIDDGARRLRDVIEAHPSPFSNAVGTIPVEAVDAHSVRTTWRSEFDAEESVAPNVEAMMSDFYATTIDDLHASCAESRPWRRKA